MKTSLPTPYFFALPKTLFCLPLFFALTVTGFPADVTWMGSLNNGLWDQTTLNWLDSADQPVAYQDIDFEQDSLLFGNDGARIVNVEASGISLLRSFAVDSGQNYEFHGGALSGIGGIDKTGNGSLTLAGANTYTGATVIGNRTAGAGRLILGHQDAAQNSAVTAYGSLIEATRPGTRVRSLSLLNSATGGSTLRVNANASNTRSESAALTAGTFNYESNAQLEINLNGFSGTPMTYWILSGTNAGAINPDNVFVNVSAGARVRRNVIHEASSLYVSLTMSSFASLYGDWLTDNGWRVARTIDRAAELGIHTPLFTALEGLPGYGELVGPALNQLHAEAYVTEMAYAVQLQRSFNARLMNWRNMVANNGYYGYINSYDYIDYRGNVGRKLRRYDLWATVSAESMTRGRINDYSGYEGDSSGVAVGAEWKFSPCAYGGIAFGYDDASLAFKSINAENSLRAARVSLYGGYVNSRWYSSGYLGYSKDWHTTVRRIRIPAFETVTPPIYAPGFSADARSRYNDNVVTAGLEFGKFYSCYDLNIIPTIGLDYVFIQSPQIAERNAGSANLVVNSMAYNSLRTPVGVRTNMDLPVFSALVLTPELRLFGVTEWIERSVRRSAYFAEVWQAGNFYSEGGDWGRNGFLFGLGLTAQCGNRITLGFNYDCEIWKEYNRHIGSAFLNCRW